MKCPSCGRMMVNMITFLKCSNGFCDYEEDVEPQQISAACTWAIGRYSIQDGSSLDWESGSHFARQPQAGWFVFTGINSRGFAYFPSGMAGCNLQLLKKASAQAEAECCGALLSDNPHRGHFAGGVYFQKNVSQVACRVRPIIFVDYLTEETRSSSHQVATLNGDCRWPPERLGLSPLALRTLTDSAH